MNESTPDRAFVREAGSGPTLLCLHSNASSSTQWRALMELLSPRFRVLAPDQLGAGRSPPWPAARRDGAGRLDDEVALLAPVLA
ncbi:MAG: alpha/beta fold hydrolase, partial [Rubrivivax sp.]|nr:alpha/beta fold hydrolase [Rubrivivax sp.]